ncbi:MAG: hypothetical protein ACI4GY_03855 [Acutalibacteraceae bacterium]
MKKRLAALFMVLTLVSAMAINASAQTYFWLGTDSYSYNGNSYCTCTLTKPGKKDAKVTVKLYSTGPLTIKMTDNRGRSIWSENNSIRPNAWNNAARTYNLGRDHSVYRLYFKSTYGRGAGSCNVTSPKNCSIK